MSLFVVFCDNRVPDGYYQYQGNHYYHQGASWFVYSVLSHDWSQTQSLDDAINKENANQYRVNNFDGTKFESTQWYDSGSDDDYDSDSDYDWDDDDSWDSDDTDWDSDW